MSNYTKERLEQMFAERRRIKEQERIKESQRLAKQKAGEALRRKLHRELLHKLEKEAEAKQKTAQVEASIQALRAPLPVYRTKYVERFPDNEELYTKEELMNPPEGESGRINWDVWELLVRKTRESIYLS